MDCSGYFVDRTWRGLQPAECLCHGDPDWDCRQVKNRQSGVTLMELVIVVAIAGAMATLVLPAFSSGLDNLRLSQASDSVAAFLNGALNRAERRQQVIEISISPKDNLLLLRSADSSFERKLDLPDGVRIEGEARQFVLMPGAAPA